MKDQAEKLRKIIENIRFNQPTIQHAQEGHTAERSARVITVTSGKGGVGKTNISVNLAIALSELGKRVIIIDADFGFANVDVVMGMAPKYSLIDVIFNNMNILDILTNGPSNVKFISGGSGFEDLVNIEKERLNKFIKSMELLDKLADIIIIDTGAGVSENIMSFILASDEVILVTTPEPTAVTDAYSLLKMVVNRDKDKMIKLLINRAESIREADNVCKRISMVAEKFLNVKPCYLGYVLQDENIYKAVKEQQPFTLKFPHCQASRDIRLISRKLISIEDEETVSVKSGGMKSFVNRLIGFIGKQNSFKD